MTPAERRADLLREVGAVRIVASLHSLSCTGPTRATGCRCRKVRIAERVEAELTPYTIGNHE